MKKYNRNGRKSRALEEYDRKLNKVRRKYKKKVNAEDGIEPYQVEVRNGNVDKAYKILERMLKKDRVLENYKERQRYKKPSKLRNEKKCHFASRIFTGRITVITPFPSLGKSN